MYSRRPHLFVAVSFLLPAACAFAQTSDNSAPQAVSDKFHIEFTGSMPVAGTSNTHPFESYDISYVDTELQLLSVSSRSSKAVVIYDAFTDKFLGQTPAIFAGVGVDNPHSGPDGNMIIGDQLWAGDYPSLVRVFDLRGIRCSRHEFGASDEWCNCVFNGNGEVIAPEIAEITTGGTLRADEMDYDPYDGIAAVSNGDEAPPFLTLISTRTFTVLKKITFNGENGTPDATIGGIGSILFDSATGKFLVSIPQLGSNLTAGAVAEMDPVSGKIAKVFNGIDNCMAAGMAQGPGEKVLIGCDPGFPPPDPVAFAPRTYIINGRTGEILANIKEVGGADEAWYNPGDHRFYTGSRDFFISPTAKSATGVIGVIDADTNQWIENIKAGSNSHSVAANPRNNQIFVPLKDPNPLCGTLPGCIAIFTDKRP